MLGSSIRIYFNEAVAIFDDTFSELIYSRSTTGKESVKI